MGDKEAIEQITITEADLHKPLLPSEYLHYIYKDIPKAFLSSGNYSEILQIAELLHKPISSFFGFEIPLTDFIPCSDYLCAVSSLRQEKQALKELLHSDSFAGHIDESPVWNILQPYVDDWCLPGSVLDKHLFGLWFEFDLRNKNTFFEPSVFLQHSPIRHNSDPDWLLMYALNKLINENVSLASKTAFLKSIRALPPESYIYNVGCMLARDEPGFRIVITRLYPKQIIDYLQRLGFSHTQEISELLYELQHYVNRFVLHVTLTDHLHPRIDIECSFSPDRYANERQWVDFLSYLAQKKLVTISITNALLEFIGTDLSSDAAIFDPRVFAPAVTCTHTADCVYALTRYISHIKLTYHPDKPLTAKAYPGVRLLCKEGMP